MKAVRTFTLVCILSLMVLSCEKDSPHYSANDFEWAMHNYMSDYRVAQGKTALVWFPDIFIEAREQSIAWKKSGDINAGINERIGTIQDHWAPESLAWFPDYFMGKADTSSAYQRFQVWIADSATKALILDDFVQSGIGVATSDDVVYITTFLMKITTK